MVCSIVIPVVLIAIIAIVFVPGATVPKGTPKSLVWKRKLWELHTGWLGLALSLVSAWFITNGLKNLMGKPRPDLLSRCQPDIANLGSYVVGGIANISSNGQLVSGAICKNPDTSLVNDGFRSFPSGHASFSAAGLVYLTLFIASKFAVIPFLAPSPNADSASASLSAFPSRTTRLPHSLPYSNAETNTYELSHRGASTEPLKHRTAPPLWAARHQAAAPPVYLLVATAAPFLASVFIASSRWFNFRHHGFDILFGFSIGFATAVLSFRFYHLPLGRGAGWAWGPRSEGRAFWAGVGRSGFAAERGEGIVAGVCRAGDEEEALGGGLGDGGNGSGRVGQTLAVGRKGSRPESEG